MYTLLECLHGVHGDNINPLNAKLNPICPLLTLFGAHHIFHVSRLRVNDVTKSTLVMYIPSNSISWFSYTSHSCCTSINVPTYLICIGSVFLGAFAKLRKATISFVMSICPSVCPHGTTWLPLDRFSWNLIFDYFSKNYRRSSSLIKIGQKLRALCVKTTRHFWSYLAQFFLELETFETRVVEEMKTHILCSVTIVENRAFYEIMWRNIVEPDRPKMTMWRMCITCWIT
jgi:hypothetical protein